MAWSLIISLLILIWAISLGKILHASRSPSKVAFPFNAVSNKRNVLLVIAHPDDESMFFSPTINYLTSRGHNLHILCISTGNADGKGNIRREELFQACAILKVSLQQVKILVHDDLQDGFDKTWSHNLLAEIIKEEIITHAIDLVISFDYYGISGHRNHQDVHHGIRTLLYGTSQRNIEAWELISTNKARKYSGPVDIWLSFLCSMYYPRGETHCLLNEQPHRSFLAMAQHQSQWVWYVSRSLYSITTSKRLRGSRLRKYTRWFRKLFVLFSSYTYVNTLRKINVSCL